VTVGIIWRKPVLTRTSIVGGGMLASVNSVKIGLYLLCWTWKWSSTEKCRTRNYRTTSQGRKRRTGALGSPCTALDWLEIDLVMTVFQKCRAPNSWR